VLNVTTFILTSAAVNCVLFSKNGLNPERKKERKKKKKQIKKTFKAAHQGKIRSKLDEKDTQYCVCWELMGMALFFTNKDISKLRFPITW